MLRRLLLLAVLLAVGVVRADYLYWMIGDVDPGVVHDSPQAFARVCVVDMNATAKVLGYLGQGPGDLQKFGSEAIFSDLGKYNSAEYGFFVEVWNFGILNTQPDAPNQWFVSGVSDIAGYTALANALHISYFGPSDPNIKAAWAPVIHVPEPTGGMMLLLGLAMLALRRRRA